MFFDSWKNFFEMGTHGSYVWSAYAITALILTWNIITPLLSRRKIKQRFKRLWTKLSNN